MRTERGHRRSGFLVAAGLVVAGCSGDGGGVTEADTSTAVATSIAPEGFPVVPADAVQEERWRLPGGPDWLAADDSGVWVKHDDGAVAHVPADGGEVDLTVELGGDKCQGLGVGLDAVWACAGADVARIDPATGEVDAVLSVGKAFSQGHLVTASGRLWVLTGDGSTLVGVDPGTGAPVTTVPLGVRGTDVAVGDAGLWVVSMLDGQVLRVDPAGTVALRVTGVDEPVAVAVTDAVWVGAVGETRRIDPVTGQTLASSEIGTGRDGAVAVAPDGVWVRSAERFLVRLDPDSGAAVGGISADVESSGDVVVAFGSVWTTAYDDATLFRIPAEAP
jgi:outer membrane protein assembly factor BamB